LTDLMGSRSSTGRDAERPSLGSSYAGFLARTTEHQCVLGLGSYQTAWTMLHRLRRAMVRPGRDQLSGKVEVDETYVGGRARRKSLKKHGSNASVAK
jgi:hypothetical protein